MADQIGLFVKAYVLQLVAKAVIFFILFGLITMLVAREKSIPMLRGFVGVILSFFTCPFRYLRAAVLSMEEYGVAGEAEDSSSKQYLLNKIMIFMQAALVISSIAVFAGSVTDGWIAMVPPTQLRDAIRELEKAVVEKNAELLRLDPAVKQLNEAWKSQHDSYVNSFASEKSSKMEQLGRENVILANRINDVDPQTKVLFAKIEEFQARNARDLTTSELEESVRDLTAYLDRLSLSPEARTMINSHNANWASQKRLKMEINTMTERAVRAASQPTYEAMSSQLADIKRDLPNQEKELIDLKSKATYKVERLALSVVLGGLKFISLIWLYGLLIEVLWSAINVSSDLRKIRNSLSKPTVP